MRTTPREVCSILNKKLFRLSEIQKKVLIGTLLGDGGLRFRGTNCRLHIKHSIHQLSLVDYKRRVFRDITSMKVNVFNQVVGKTDYSFAEFVTLTHPEFTKFYNLFYSSSNKKIVPEDIEFLLVDPLSLAVWFMDDGSAEYAGASIQTHGFTEDEVEKLIRTIFLNFGLETNKRLNKGKWIIYFPKVSLPKLNHIIGNFLLEDFKYKLIPYSIRRANPVETVRQPPLFSL